MRKLLSILGVMVLALACAPLAWADNGQQTTTLLSPSGQPVGGVWQQWLNDSYMPTYNGPMVLDLNWNGQCGMTTGIGCTGTTGWTSDVAPTFGDLPETAIAAGLTPTTQRWTLLYEQGHVVDFRMLADADREAFAALWGRPIPGTDTPDEVQAAWWAGDTNSKLGEWFSYDYMMCSLWPTLTWRIVDHNYETYWDGSNGLIALGKEPNWFPTLTIARQVAYTVNSHGEPTGRTVLLPPTRRAGVILATQNRSCALIYRWLSPMAGTGTAAGT